MTLELQNSGKSALKAVSSHEEAYSTGKTEWLSKCRARSAGSTLPICHRRAYCQNVFLHWQLISDGW